MPVDQSRRSTRDGRVRIGNDVQAISAFDRFDPAVSSRIKDRVFTDAEADYCERMGYPAQHYAARWAAKEAFIKLVGGFRGFTYRSVRVDTTPSGPRLDLDEAADEALDRAFEGRAPISLDLSLSHDRETDIAMAHVVGYASESNHER